MAKEDKRNRSCLANDNGPPDDVSLDPRILRIACATPKEDCKARDIFPAFVHGGIHGAEPLPPVLRDNSIAKSESPFDRRGVHDPKPARMRATAEDKRVVEDRPTRDYLEATREFWQPYAERELTREDAREMARNLIGFFTVLREWTLRERERVKCGAVETISLSPRRKRGRPKHECRGKDKMKS